MPTPGTSIGPYILADKIGEGGMGEVYRATDTNLKRDVAIKFLPEAFTQDHERLARFQREAEVLAQLHHPNIASIFGIEESGGVRALVMELVEGPTLDERLAQGRLTVDEALGIAKQIAVALEEAHAKGIVHRDLKPANVKITPAGRVKVLDFGLAKALDPTPETSAASPTMLAHSPTLTASSTQLGVILGTAAYMSPEQARGEPVDKRADVWAFGCVLFEMLSGRTSFKENTVSDTLASVLKVEPDWSLLPADVPEGIGRLLKRCLQKNRQQRLHDIADARIEIEEMLALPPEKRAVPTVSGSRARVPLGMTAFFVLVGIGIGVIVGSQLRRSAPEPRVRRFFLPIEAAEDQQLPSRPTFSPDGRTIAYIFDNQVWLRHLDQVHARAMDGTKGAVHVFWSPDGTQVGFKKGDSLWRIPATGGQPTLVSEKAPRFFPASWGEDGRILYSDLEDIYEVPARGGEPKLLLTRDPETEQHFHEILRLPGDKGLLVVLHRDEFYDTIALWDGSERRNLLTVEGSNIEGPTYSATGHILFTRTPENDGLWAVPFSLSSLELTGEPFLVVPGGSQASAAADGTLVYLDSSARKDSELVWFDAEGTILGTIGQPQREMESPTISPDGTTVAVCGEEDSDWDIWVHDESGRKRRITFDKGREAVPQWTADGTRIVYNHPTGAFASIYAVDSDAGGARELLFEGHRATLAGDFIVFRRRTEETEGDIFMATLEPGSPPEVFSQTPADEDWPALSPDGHHVAYTSSESGTDHVFIKPFPEGSGKWQVSIDHGWRPYWSPTGDRLYFASYGNLMEVEVRTEPTLRLGTPRLMIDAEDSRLMPWKGTDIAPDGKRFVGIRNVVDEGQDEDVVEGIHLVENWFAEFEDD